MADLAYNLTFAGIPFCMDLAKAVRMPTNGISLIRTHQGESDLLAEINRRLPYEYLQEFSPTSPYPGKNLGALANSWKTDSQPSSEEVIIGDWYYPYGASRWSVFRGLATSSQVKEMLAAMQIDENGEEGSVWLPQEFVMSCVPTITTSDPTDYQITTSMYLLPPRPLGEFGGDFDGIYLITLVDERYYWNQYNSISLAIRQGLTWDALIQQISSYLDVDINYSTIPSVYSYPEPDSQLFCNQENVGTLLDAIGFNIGKTLVRNMDGSYNFQTPSEGQDIAFENRDAITPFARVMGGDLFNTDTKAGDLTVSKNATVPEFVNVTFPKYVIGNDPIPHFVNYRNISPQPSSWYEDSYGAVDTVIVPLASGGIDLGLVGIPGAYTVHDTAKAIYNFDSESAPIQSGSAQNFSGNVSLAMQIAQDYYNTQTGAAFDEVYPGIFNWDPESSHDIIWTFSTKAGAATTRVMRTEWNTTVREMQHATIPMSGYASNLAGIGGKRVAQAIRNNQQFFHQGNNVLATALLKGDTSTTLADPGFFPSDNYWKAKIDNEIILFDRVGGADVKVIYRGIDGTIPANHTVGSIVTPLLRTPTYGVNLTTYERGQYTFPGLSTSGGIQETIVKPQIQTVKMSSSTPIVMNGLNYYPGHIVGFGLATVVTNNIPSDDQQFAIDNCYIVERNGQTPNSASFYEGQMISYSPHVDDNGHTHSVLPVYVISVSSAGSSSTPQVGTLRITSLADPATGQIQLPPGPSTIYAARLQKLDYATLAWSDVNNHDDSWVVENDSRILQLERYECTLQHAISLTVVTATNTNPIIVTLTDPITGQVLSSAQIKRLLGSDSVTITGALGLTVLNGAWSVTIDNLGNVTLVGSNGVGQPVYVANSATLTTGRSIYSTDANPHGLTMLSGFTVVTAVTCNNGVLTVTTNKLPIDTGMIQSVI